MVAQLHFGTGNSASAGTTGSGTATSVSFQKTSFSNMAVGDVLIAWIHSQNPNTGTTITAPSGWTRVGAPLGVPNASASRLSGLYYYPLTNTQAITDIPSTITWTFSIGGRVASHIARASGLDLNNLIDVESTSFSSSGGSSALSIASITAMTAPTLLVGGASRQNSANTSSPPFTSFLDEFQEYKTSPEVTTAASTGSAIGYRMLSSSGATGEVVAAFAANAAAYSGELVAFRALQEETPPPADVIQLHFGVGNSASAGTTDGATATSVSFQKTSFSNMAVGDVLIAWIHSQNPGTATITSPSGWTRVGAPLGTPNTSASRLSGIYYYPLTNAQAITDIPATITWTFSVSGRVASHIARATGLDLNNLIDVESTSFSSSGGSNTLTITSITTTTAPTLLVGGASRQNSASTSSPSFTSFLDEFQEYKTSPEVTTEASTGSAIGYRVLTGAGATGDVAATFSTNATAYSGELVAFRGVDSAAPPNDGLRVGYVDAQSDIQDASLFYTGSNGTLLTPSEIRPVPEGYSSITSMLSQSPFYIAHRAGSNNWPEHSLHAYTQAVFWGVGALELSVHRTSDGVWFGLHDSTLDRTSGTSNYSPSSHTWAEVQQYMITAAATNNPAQPARPYARWEEIMDAYYTSHVFFVDIKEDWAHSNELIDKMDALPGNPKTRFIGKSYGPGSTASSTMGWNFTLKQRGYMTWGYFYEADYPTNVTNSQSVYDVLGMDYTASQAAWDHIKSFNKKVIGHIVPSAAAATSALTKGADGLMVSGVKSAVPRIEY